MRRGAQAKHTAVLIPDTYAHQSESVVSSPSSSKAHAEYSNALPESYDDQVALLCAKIEGLKQLFEQFMECHKEMKNFKDLRVPLARLSASPNVVQVTLGEFCKAVKDLKPQVTETFEQDPEIRNAKPPAPSMLSHYVNDEGLDALSTPIPHRTIHPNKSVSISDATKPFEFRIDEQGCARYPITIKWRPTAPMPDTDAIPNGLRVEVNSNNHILVSDLPPLGDAPRTSVNEDVTQWLGHVPFNPAATVPVSLKGKKRSRDGEEYSVAEAHSRRRVRVAFQDPALEAPRNPEPDIPAPLRRSVRLKTGKMTNMNRKAKTVEERTGGAWGANPGARSRTSTRRA